MVWTLKRMRKQRKLYNCMLCGKIVKPSQNSTVIMSVTKIQIVDNVYSNWGPQMVENVEVSRMEKEDNLKLLKLKREAFEVGGDVKQEDENLHGSHGGVHGCTWVYMGVHVHVHGCTWGCTVHHGTVQYITVQYSTG